MSWRQQHALLAALLLCLLAHPSRQLSVEQQQGPRVPADLNAWGYTDGPGGTPQDARARRFWDRATLRRTAGAVNYEQMRPFLQKLNRGEAVTVVAFGDSIVATHAGCFHRDEAHLRQHMKVLGSTYLRGHCDSVFKYRYVSSFLDFVNHTWPHPGEQKRGPRLPQCAGGADWMRLACRAGGCRSGERTLCAAIAAEAADVASGRCSCCPADKASCVPLTDHIMINNGVPATALTNFADGEPGVRLLRALQQRRAVSCRAHGTWDAEKTPDSSPDPRLPLLPPAGRRVPRVPAAG